MNKWDSEVYAIKMIPLKKPKIETKLREYIPWIRIFREVRTMIKLNHKNIVRMYSWWVEES